MATHQLTGPATLFFGDYRRKVLGLLLLHPGEHFHLREIARMTRTQPGTVRRELSLLARAGVIERSAQGSQVRFRANESYPIYEELRSILKKTSGLADQLRIALAPLSDAIDIALVYGSVASGQERHTSDIDLLIVGSARFEDVIRVLHPYQQDLRREINPHVYSTAEFKRKSRKERSFVARILTSPQLFIIGSADELQGLAKIGRLKPHSASKEEALKLTMGTRPGRSAPDGRRSAPSRRDSNPCYRRGRACPGAAGFRTPAST
jgi:predicted nucleotidyltransferase